MYLDSPREGKETQMAGPSDTGSRRRMMMIIAGVVVAILGLTIIIVGFVAEGRRGTRSIAIGSMNMVVGGMMIATTVARAKRQAAEAQGTRTPPGA
jgi:hypothetical protein